MTQTFEATPLTRFLHAARPDWTLAELLHVEAKLEKIGLASVPALLQSLTVPRWSINELLQLEGETGFSQETWRAFRAQAEQPRPHPLQSRAPSVLHSAPEIRPLQSELPQQGFRVVEDLEVRERPSVDAPSLGSSLAGDTLLGVEETFDGWVKPVVSAFMLAQIALNTQMTSVPQSELRDATPRTPFGSGCCRR